MFLTEIKLRNWRSYANATFRIPAPDREGRRNIILIGAQNGVGKTSFLMALYLGMFGREAMSLIEGFRTRNNVDDKFLSYQKLIESILHRPAKDQPDAHCSVILTYGEEAQEKITITRRWMFRPGGRVRDIESNDGEEVLIEAGGNKKLFTSWKDANQKIAELLFPCNVMPCFFFDGEQAQARVEAAGGHALFEAVKALYGTGLLDDLTESLRSYIANERSRLQREIGTVQVDGLEQKRQELDQLRDNLKVVQADVMQQRKKKVDAEEDRQQLENSLYAMVGDKAADIEEYSSTMSALQTEEAKLQQGLVDGLTDLALPLGLSKVSKRMVATLSAERVRDRWLLLKDEAADKASSIIEEVLPGDVDKYVSPPLLDIQTTQLRTRLEKALAALWSPPPTDCAESFSFPFLEDSDRTSVIGLVQKYSQPQSHSLTELALELHSVVTRLEETRQRFERTRDIQPQLQKLKGDLQTALDHQREISSILSGFEYQEKGIQQQISDLRGAIGQMESRKEAGSPIQEKLDVAQRLRALVDDSKEMLIPLCQAALEDRCSLHFRAMVSGEYDKFRARFDPNSEPWLEGNKGQQVLVSSLSGAQKRVFGLAFTLAVADVSQSDAPIVVDTPVGNMDSEYRARVLQYISEAAPGQVIFLSHNEEIYGQYAKALSPKIRKQFLVTFDSVQDGAGVSTVRDDKYF